MSSAAVARINVVLAFIGLFIASTLSVSTLLNINLPCGTSSGCDLVTKDPRSVFLGVPIAYYGFLAYGALALVTSLRVMAPNFAPRKLHLIGYVFSGIGLLISILLTVYSIRVLHAICPWCIGSAVTMSLLFAFHAFGNNAVEDRQLVNGFDVALPFFLALAWFMGVFTVAQDMRMREGQMVMDKEALEKLDQQELAPPDAHYSGPNKSLASVVMFGDLTCPTCKLGYEHVRALQRRRKDFRFTFRHLPLETHPTALPAALVAEVAADHGKYWDYLDRTYASFFEEQAAVKIGSSLGIPRAEIERRLADENDVIHKRVRRDEALTEKLGLHSTPSCFVVADGFYPEPTAFIGIEDMLEDVKFQTLLERRTTKK